MKKIFNKVGALLFLVSIIGCVSFKDQLLTGVGNAEQARKNVITDFANTFKTPRKYLKKRQGIPFDVFWVREIKTKNEYWSFSVLPENDGHISLGIKDSLGKVPISYFPNNYLVKKGKLFIWKDIVTPLRKDVLDVLEYFSVLDSTDIKWELGLLPEDFEDARVLSFDDELKGTHYYVCKRRTEKYKKVFSNKALGFYKPPKLNCYTRNQSRE